jgi:tricorn protease-like protein
VRQISRPLANDMAPAFDARGERVFFLGLRGVQPPLPGAYEWEKQVYRAWGE